jgi:CBS domain-containing protein
MCCRPLRGLVAGRFIDCCSLGTPMPDFDCVAARDDTNCIGSAGYRGRRGQNYPAHASGARRFLAMAKIPPQLQEAAEKIHQDGKPKVVRVKELLSWFHAQRRGLLVVREIRAALRKAKLVTVPDFEVAYIDQRIKLKPLQQADKKPVTSKEIVVEEHGAETDFSSRAVSGGSVPDPAPRIGMLKAANTPPLSVSRDTELSDAIAKMLMNDYSQLPVMQGERIVQGLVSWRSIGRARVRSGNPCKYVRDCIEEANVVSSETHLFEAIGDIAARDVVLVRNNENKIIGLVTTYDISSQFRDLSEPFLLLSEIENHLRRLIDGKFSLEELRANRDPNDANRKIENVANLTFGEYIRLLDKPANWERLGYDLSRAECTKRLREVGRIRNDVMHFHPDGISPDDMELLRDTRKFLQML